MEQTGPSIAKKIWHIFKVAYFMLKKGICKRKILLDLNIMMKRSKIAGQNIQNIMFHHPENRPDGGADLKYAARAVADPEEYEFSCSSTPVHPRRNYSYLFGKKNKSQQQQQQPDIEAVNKVLQMMMMTSSDDVIMASPALPHLGFGRSPAARQLRITDSPYPVHDGPAGEEDGRVDEAAEDFINKFYSQLKQQKYY